MPGYKTWLVLLGLATLVWIGFFAPIVLVPVEYPSEWYDSRNAPQFEDWQANRRVITGRETLFLRVTPYYIPLAAFLVLGALEARAHCRSPAERLTWGWWICERDGLYAGWQFSLAFLLCLPLIVAVYFIARWLCS